MEREKKINQEERRAHAEQIDQPRVMSAVAPKRNRRPDHANEKNRIEDQAFAGNEINHIVQRRVPGLSRLGVRRDMVNCHPTMLLVPNQDWQSAKEINQESQIRTG